jgi:ABC-type sugar transport system ATPase subunit
VRPEDFTLVGASEGHLTVRVDLVEPLGRETLLHVAPLPAQPGETALRVVAPPDPALAAGQTLGLRVRAGAIHLFDPASGDRLD